MSVKDDKRMITTYMRMLRLAMGVSLLEHRRNKAILEEAKVESISMVMRRRRVEWFEHVKRRNETENIPAVVAMKMEGKFPIGRNVHKCKQQVTQISPRNGVVSGSRIPLDITIANSNRHSIPGMVNGGLIHCSRKSAVARLSG